MRRAVPMMLIFVASLQCGDVLGDGGPDSVSLGGGDDEGTGGEESGAGDTGAQGCLEALASSGAVYTPLIVRDDTPPHEGCGMVDGVSVSRGPSGIRYRPPIRVSCAFARALPAIEQTIQSTAAEVLGEPIEVARTMGSYGCRNIESTRSPGRLSEHSFGNAIDLGELWSRRTKAVVLRDFRSEGPPGAFLRTVATRLREAGALERLLDPDYNAAHRNHFHLEGHPLRP